MDVELPQIHMNVPSANAGEKKKRRHPRVAKNMADWDGNSRVSDDFDANKYNNYISQEELKMLNSCPLQWIKIKTMNCISLESIGVWSQIGARPTCGREPRIWLTTWKVGVRLRGRVHGSQHMTWINVNILWSQNLYSLIVQYYLVYVQIIII